MTVEVGREAEAKVIINPLGSTATGIPRVLKNLDTGLEDPGLDLGKKVLEKEVLQPVRAVDILAQAVRPPGDIIDRLYIIFFTNF